MKNRILIVLAVVLACAAGIAAAGSTQADPGPVAKLLSGQLERINKQPGALERQGESPLKGERYVLPFSGGQLQLYAYRSQDEASRDLLCVDESGFQIGGTSMDWEDCPHYYLRDSVIVLYVGSDAKVLDMLERLCGPQIRGSQVQL